VFDFNLGSARVLEKAGFRNEGYLRGHYKKDGRIFDGKVYGLLAEDLQVDSPGPGLPDRLRASKAKI
jgi:RimJ/RimL family protein N-acetyltransferase